MTVPTSAEITEAWISLPRAERDRLGLIAVEMVFAGFVGGDALVVEDRIEDFAVLDEATRDAAMAAEDVHLTALHREIEAALPVLFGPDGENPAWSENAGPVPTPAAIAYGQARRQERANHKRRVRSLRIRLGQRGMRLCPSYGGYIVTDRASGDERTGRLDLTAAEAWLTGLNTGEAA